MEKADNQRTLARKMARTLTAEELEIVAGGAPGCDEWTPEPTNVGPGGDTEQKCDRRTTTGGAPGDP